VAAVDVAALALTGCTAAAAAQGDVTSACTPAPAVDLVPTDGTYLGVNLDWGQKTLADYAAALGHRPAVAVSFTSFPMTAQESGWLDAAVQQVAHNGGLLLLTLEPQRGLAAVTADLATQLASQLDAYNELGVPVVVRFAHEMNGSWYRWGQQPAAYVAAFRRVAGAVHAGAPGRRRCGLPTTAVVIPSPAVSTRRHLVAPTP